MKHDELLDELSGLCKKNAINNFARWKTWARQYPDDANKYASVVGAAFPKRKLFFTPEWRGKVNNFLTREEFGALVAKEGIGTSRKYHEWRMQQPKELKDRLPYSPEDYYRELA
jgi:hypothetical protein